MPDTLPTEVAHPTPPDHRRPSRFGRWLIVVTLIVGVVGVPICLGWPLWRQKQLIAQLRERQFEIDCRSIFGPSSLDDPFVSPSWKDYFYQPKSITRHSKECSDNDLADIGKLLHLMYDEGPGTGVELSLSAKNITDQGLRHLRNARRLTGLFVESNKLTDAGMEHLRGLTNLSYLELRSPRITGSGRSHLSGLRHLKILHCNYEQLSDAELARLPVLPVLEYLNLGGTKITDAGLGHLKSFPQLLSLDLSSTAISDAGLIQLQSSTGLQQLNLVKTRVTDRGIPLLAGFSDLQHVDLFGTKVTVSGKAELRRLVPGVVIKPHHSLDLNFNWFK